MISSTPGPTAGSSPARMPCTSARAAAASRAARSVSEPVTSSVRRAEELQTQVTDLRAQRTELVLAQARQALAPVGLDLDHEGEAEQRAQQTGDDLAPAAARCERVRERAPGRSRFGLPLQVVGWHLRPSAGGAGWPRRWRRS